MFHFYSNPLTVLNDYIRNPEIIESLQSLHFEAVRKLPSFQNLIEGLVASKQGAHAKRLLQDDSILRDEIKISIGTTDVKLTDLLRKMLVISSITKGPIGKIELYSKAFRGDLNESDLIHGLLDSIKQMSPTELIVLVSNIMKVIDNGSLEFNLDGWLNDGSDIFECLSTVKKQASSLVKLGEPVRSSYAAHSKAVRTTVIAQKVQLSYEKSSLSKHDNEYTDLIDMLIKSLKTCLKCENPQDWFLHEVWLFDLTSPYKDVFTPRPRFVLEDALFKPSGYLLGCDPAVEVLSSASVPTAILYNMYLESGSMINISDLWTSFLSIMEGEEDGGCDERIALMLFYQGLADLKLLGMIKHSKRKVDHLGKSIWRGL